MVRNTRNSEMTFEEYRKAVDLKEQYEELLNLPPPKRRSWKPFTDKCHHVALFFDDHGHHVGERKINWKHKYFDWKGRAFHFLPDDASYFKIRKIFSTTKYYHYNLNNAQPLLLDKKLEPVLNNEVYKTILDSDLVKKLNPKKFNLNWKLIFIGLIVIFAVYYFASGGTLTG